MDKSYGPSRLMSRRGGDTGRPGVDCQRFWTALHTPVGEPREAVVGDGEKTSSSGAEGNAEVISTRARDVRTRPCGDGLGDGHT